MKASDIPATKVPTPWAKDAGAPYIRAIPNTSQIGIQDGAASWPTGYVPLNMIPEGSGGVPPFGQDTNGVLNVISAWTQWMNAGGPLPWDSAFSTTIGGYPKGAIVASATTFGTFWLCTADDNTTNPDASGAGWISFLPAGAQLSGGQAVLTYGSSSAILLMPKGGNNIVIAGVSCSIPAAGVSLAPTALTPGTPYYIYAVATAGVVTSLEASLTGHITDTTAGNIGIEIKSGDNTRSLVGYWMVAAGPTWSAIATQGLSWFNQIEKSARTTFSTDRGTSSSTIVEINSEIRNSFLTWASRDVDWSVNGEVSIGASSGVTSVVNGVAFDGITPEPSVAIGSTLDGQTVSTNGAARDYKSGLSEGLHYATVVGAVQSGVSAGAGWYSTLTTGGSVKTPTQLSITVKG